MKHSTKNILIMALGAGIVFSCAKEEITVQKNDSTKWEIDKSITDNDIRERLGYNTLQQQASLFKEDAEVPMLSFANIPISGKNTVVARLELRNQAEKEVKVSLAYDATLFDKVKDKYAGYEIAEASLVQLSETQKTIAKGEKGVNFEFLVENKSDFDKMALLPFAFKATEQGSEQNLLGEDNIFCIKIYPKKAMLTLDSSSPAREVTIERGSGKISIDNKNIDFSVTTNVKIPEEISLGLVRGDDAGSSDIVPIGVESELPKVPFKDVMNAKLSFKLENINLLNQKGRYTLPLKLVAYDANLNFGYAGYYSGIRVCNQLLEKAEEYPQVPANLREKYKYEARTMRAWLYGNLTLYFGDVPLVTKVENDYPQGLTRTPANEIRTWVLNKTLVQRKSFYSLLYSSKGIFLKLSTLCSSPFLSTHTLLTADMLFVSGSIAKVVYQNNIGIVIKFSFIVKVLPSKVIPIKPFASVLSGK